MGHCQPSQEARLALTCCSPSSLISLSPPGEVEEDVLLLLDYLHDLPASGGLPLDEEPPPGKSCSPLEQDGFSRGRFIVLSGWHCSAATFSGKLLKGSPGESCSVLSGMGR